MCSSYTAMCTSYDIINALQIPIVVSVTLLQLILYYSSINKTLGQVNTWLTQFPGVQQSQNLWEEDIAGNKTCRGNSGVADGYVQETGSRKWSEKRKSPGYNQDPGTWNWELADRIWKLFGSGAISWKAPNEMNDLLFWNTLDQIYPDWD